jgi:isocitrate dehydrogenase
LGSAVNPVLREGNSDRRVAGPVKEFAKNNPHSMGAWEKSSKSHVAHMDADDFYGSEKSYVSPKAQTVTISLNDKELKKVDLLESEVIDGSRISVKSLKAFFEKEIKDAKEKNVLLSLHMKATMMKVSDPVIFGHCVSVFYKEIFDKHADVITELAVNVNNGIGDLYSKIKGHAKEESILADLKELYAKQPSLAMVDSDKGITNLHVPSDVIIDASMPAMIRTSGKMWGPDGKAHDTKAMIPDRCYAGIYSATIDFCKENGAFDVTTMGNVANVGLMAKKAEEYGSHDKTFIVSDSGTMKVTAADGTVCFEHSVEKEDIWRMCQTKDIAIKDWVKLGVNRASATKNPAIFWLDEKRAHDANLIEKVNLYLKDHDTTGLDIQIMAPIEATKHACSRVKKGLDTISVTGNVLRDYLTDLFPILELGTSAKMLSIVPLLAGGGLFETGAGGSAPKHVQQLESENHLRWDSLGEFLALGVSIEDLAIKNKNVKAKVLATALDTANSKFLATNKSPSRKVGELDNRGSHFYLAMFWAEALANQTENSGLKEKFTKVSTDLISNEAKIVDELNKVQGVKVDMGGYFDTDDIKLEKIMRPSETLNSIINSLL